MNASKLLIVFLVSAFCAHIITKEVMSEPKPAAVKKIESVTCSVKSDPAKNIIYLDHIVMNGNDIWFDSGSGKSFADFCKSKGLHVIYSESEPTKEQSELLKKVRKYVK
ncbi:hypothetical protein UJUPTIQU_CDS0028 [Pectobacterium phage Abuela]|uniref:Uncharacterized protein n=2 Tax=unclassified Caudoviricetes TaxID=2788787 RepID=A0AB39ABW3_9CAUD|nr:hypothetical protein Abuela_48 [Pectobacterium phage Abuela]